MPDDLVKVQVTPEVSIRTKPEYVMTQAEFLTLLREGFGESPYDWAFVCPNCGDIATGADIKAALEVNPRSRPNGEPVVTSDILGQECIGRTLGVLVATKTNYTGRGCDWVAFGLIMGPLIIECPDGDEIRQVPSFRPNLPLTR